MPEPVPVPLTKPWFLGVANVRGGLYGMIDFGAFLTGRQSARAADLPRQRHHTDLLPHVHAAADAVRYDGQLVVYSAQ